MHAVRTLRRGAVTLVLVVSAGAVGVGCGSRTPAPALRSIGAATQSIANGLPHPSPVHGGGLPRVHWIKPGKVPTQPKIHNGWYPPVHPQPQNPKKPGPRICAGFTLTGAYFDTNEPTFTKDAGPFLDKVEQQVGNVGMIVIYGNSDERPTTYPGGNFGLSRDRARAIAYALIGRGVDPKRIVDIEGRGSSNPVDPGHNENAYRLNRRVEVGLVCPPGSVKPTALPR